MTAAIRSLPLNEPLAALLRGEPAPWASLEVSTDEMLRFCIEEDLAGLAHRGLRSLDHDDWPAELRGALARAAREEATRETLRRRELIRALDALAAAGIAPLLLKGTALAYTAYPSPELRPRSDTDLLIRREEVDVARRILQHLGYREPAYCDGELLFCQFEVQRTDEFGVLHALDFHWKISTQSLFSGLFSYDELADGAVSIPALGSNARAPGLVQSLLLACVHPVMHHRNVERLIWVHDIRLLASSLTPEQWNGFAELARSKGVATICAHELALAGRWLNTAVPADVIAALSSPPGSEPTATYLAPDRRWHDELVSNVRGLGSWRDRLRLLREVAFPGASYMLKAYDLSDRLSTRALLPLLYAHRGLRGVGKVLRGEK
ncbi:MAG: nucleotidyltransferase family protein [Gemmatimonadetes bacterium]|nr:nucleotidyltransferase family protein [Gemmatimonadota bacterium]